MRSELQHSSWIADLHPPRWLWLLLVALPLVALTALIGYQTTQVLPRIALVPGYSVRDQKGEPLTNEMMRGKLVIYAFIAPDCNAPCTNSMQLLQQLQQEVRNIQADDIALHYVLSSSDLETTASLQAQAQKMELDSERWHFITSDPNHFQNIFRENFLEDGQGNNGSNAGEPMLVLADGWGIVRATYPALDLALLRHDLHLVAQEANNSTGVNRVAYEAVHLFTCHSDLNATTYSQP